MERGDAGTDAGDDAGRPSLAATGTARAGATEGRAAAFFDIDNTLIRGASIFHLARGLRRRGVVGPRDIARFAWQQLRFVMRGERLDDITDIQQRALTLVAGHSVAELRAVGEEVYDHMLARRVWPGTLELARDHLAAGRPVWLVSATPIEVAEVIATRLGLTGAVGTVSEHVDGIYTGKLIGGPVHGEAKAAAVARIAADHDLDLAASSAYSDSVHDVPLLSLVGHPVVINPDAALRGYAKAKGWTILDYRTRRRRAVRIGLPVAAGVGAVLGAAVTAAVVARRRR